MIICSAAITLRCYIFIFASPQHLTTTTCSQVSLAENLITSLGMFVLRAVHVSVMYRSIKTAYQYLVVCKLFSAVIRITENSGYINFLFLHVRRLEKDKKQIAGLKKIKGVVRLNLSSHFPR